MADFDFTTAKPDAPFDYSTARPTTQGRQPNGMERAFMAAARNPVVAAVTHGVNMVDAAANEGANALTFGGTDMAGAALYHALHNDVPYKTALEAARDQTTQRRTDYPVSSLAGDVAGAIEGGGAAVDALKLAGNAPVIGGAVQAAGRVLAPAAKAQGASLASNVGRVVGNVAKSAAIGGTVSGGITAANGGTPDQIVEAGAAGAVLSPVLETAAGAIIQRAQPTVSKAMRILAGKINEDPAQLQMAFDNFKKYTGQTPPMAAILDAKSQGAISQLANANGTVGDMLAQRAEANAAQNTATLPGRIEAATGTPPQSIRDLTIGRKSAMDTAMGPIRDEAVPLDGTHASILADPRVRDATRDNPELRKAVSDAVEDISKYGQSTALTINDVDAIRQSLGSRQSAFANPNNSAHNSQTAFAYGQMRDRVTSLVDGSVAGPTYKAAIDQFHNDSNYISGFKHGMAGKDVSEADTDKLIGALNSSHGQEGYQSGLATRLQNAAGDTRAGARGTASALTEPGMSATLGQTFTPAAADELAATGTALTKGQAALDAVAPSKVHPDAEGSGVQVGQAAGAVLAHSPAGLVFHATRAMPEVFGRLSPKVQDTIGRYLADPQMAQQGINLLKRAGATQADLRNLAAALGTDLAAQAATKTAGPGQ